MMPGTSLTPAIGMDATTVNRAKKKGQTLKFVPFFNG